MNAQTADGPLIEFSRDHAFVERFRREAVACTKIGHPNIIDITDFGKTGSGAFFFAMELLDGKTLAKLLTDEGPMPVERVLHLAKQMCGALAAAHSHGIVHRDLKPENVMAYRPSIFLHNVQSLHMRKELDHSTHGRR